MTGICSKKQRFCFQPGDLTGGNSIETNPSGSRRSNTTATYDRQNRALAVTLIVQDANQRASQYRR